MPLYEFQCQKCNHLFERIQSVSAPDPQCPKCEGNVERLLHAPAVQFKGSGWYATDYAKKSASSGQSDSKPAADNTSTKPESKTESKPETKTSTPSKE